MSIKSVPSLHLSLEGSFGLAAAITAVHGLAAVAAWANDLPWGVRAAIFVAVVGSAYRTLREQVFAVSLQGRSLSFEGAKGWRLSDGQGHGMRLGLLSSTVVTRHICILHFRREADGRRQYLLVCRDCVDEESFRRLRVLLLGLARHFE